MVKYVKHIHTDMYAAPIAAKIEVSCQGQVYLAEGKKIIKDKIFFRQFSLYQATNIRPKRITLLTEEWLTAP